MAGTWKASNPWGECKWWGLIRGKCIFARTEHTKEIYMSFFNARQQKDGKVSVSEQRLEKLLQSIVMKEASFKRVSLLMIWS